MKMMRRASAPRLTQTETLLRSWLTLLIFAALTLASSAIAESQPTPTPDPTIEQILIKGQRYAAPDVFVVSPDRVTPNEPDTANLMELIPGGAVIDNGAVSGQVQYRGMFGNRIDVRVNDMYINPGGPNWMDPPLHYAPRPLVDSLEVDRGIAPVRVGPETIGGSARAKLKRSHFGDDADFEFGADVQAGGRSADESFAGGGMVSAANDTHRVHILGSAEFGDDKRAGDGTVKPMEYERYSYGIGYGVRFGEHQIGFDYRRSDTDNSGNPSLPMDIQFMKTHLFSGDYERRLGELGFLAKVHYSDVDHAMNNYSLRPTPMKFRRADAESQGLGWKLEANYPVGIGSLSVGTDGHRASHDMRISDPTAPLFFVDNFNDVHRNRYGGFAQWEGEFAQRWDLEAGIRYTRILMDAGKVDASPARVLPPAIRLRKAFNAADRSQSEDLIDAVVKLGVEVVPSLKFELGLGRKTRAPSYLERYAWLPLEVTGGLGDGNNYVGDLDLDHEVSYEVEGGFEWRNDRIYLAPRAYYRQVDDYIQGVLSTDMDVIMVSSMNGDTSPLVYSNVEAEFYGFDVAYGIDLPCRLEFEGTLGWVRGKRRDTHDDLYRIAPLHGRSTLTYRREFWSVSLESVYAARQSHVSAENSEKKTGAYGIANVFGSWEVSKGVALDFGIENVFDKSYGDHLAGVNRVSNSAVKKGGRIPGLGRSVFGRLTGRF